ncbi:MAG: glycosyltransferase, partial [Anaerolineae bacterium]|nr:glycosyltransferase [Anaerolineae bacterium]
MEGSLKTAVVVPTYNESDNIGILAQEILSLPVQLVIVDDNSPDGTGEIADEWARKDSRVFVLHRPRKMGLG